jgi:two-component system, chemotaxis family, protein-glutamate methylesterase/glutaminase
MTILNGERLPRDVAVLGASAGGVKALMALFAALPRDFGGRIAVVIHRSPIYEGVLGHVLGRRSAVPLLEPLDGDPFERGRAYLAPRDHHLRIEGDVLRVSRGPREHHSRPAVDPLFMSAAESWGKRVVGVVLSGTGDDGVAGLIAIRAAGGLSLVQHPDEATYDGMPRSALVHDHVHAALSIEGIAEALTAPAEGEDVRTPATPAASRDLAS